MNLEKIQEMWEADSKIDMDNLHDESIKIPQLHQKYYTLYTTIKLLRTKASDTLAKTKLDRYNYYSGKAPAEVYVEEPFPYKVRDKESMSLHLNADTKLSNIKLKVEYYDVMIAFLEDILKMIHNRGYQVKNSIDFLKFQSGMGF
jgi:hypothetical protein